jgi:hypothetical protein
MTCFYDNPVTVLTAELGFGGIVAAECTDICVMAKRIAGRGSPIACGCQTLLKSNADGTAKFSATVEPKYRIMNQIFREEEW